MQRIRIERRAIRDRGDRYAVLPLQPPHHGHPPCEASASCSVLFQASPRVVMIA